MNRWVALVAIGQLAVLAFMAGEREWISRAGETMFLRTAPVDPRDPMRGDYVRFDYDIARVPKALVKDEAATWFELPEGSGRRRGSGQRVYATVQLDDERIAHLESVSNRRPATGPFLRGRVEFLETDAMRIRFGVEAMFMEQGRAKDLEDEVRRRDGLPMNIRVAVGSGGIAVLQDYRWEPLGLRVTFDWTEPDPARGQIPTPTGRRLRTITAELKNYSERPVAVVVRPGGRTFRMLPNERDSHPAWRWVGETDSAGPITADMIRVLAPGDSHRETLDLERPEWFVRSAGRGDGAPKPLSAVENPWGATFRLHYQPPSREEVAAFPHAGLVRHAAIRSRAFNAAAGVD